MKSKNILMAVALGALLSGCFGAGQGGQSETQSSTTGGIVDTKGGTISKTIENVVSDFEEKVATDITVYFAYNKYILSDEAKVALDKQVEFISQYEGLVVVVEGHADERGTREYNFALGQKRAEAVRAYLESKDNGRNKYKVISYGKERPVVLGSGETVWSKNRRGVTVIQ